jgi:DNA-binding transcriptional MerR regulator
MIVESMYSEPVEAGMRIGELSRRTGVSPELLRAWEQRYGLLQPHRSPGGFRLYSADDEARVRRTTALIAEGLSAAEAARAAQAAPGRAAHAEPADPDDPAWPAPLLESLADELARALDEFDSTAAHAVMDRLFNTFSMTAVVDDVLVPYLRDLGERWAEGRVTVAQEHFASHFLRGRMLAAAGDWGDGGPSSALLACPPGEDHDLGLVLFGVLLSRRGWRITFLGADTPFDTMAAGVRAVRPTVVVLATLDADLFGRHADDVARLATSVPVAVAAPVDPAVVAGLGARALPGSIAEAARRLAEHPDPASR